MLSMEKLIRDNGLFEVSLNKYDDLLVLNCMDLSVFERFTTLYDNVEAISKEANEEMKELNKKYGENTEDVLTGIVRSYISANVSFSKKVMAELNTVFGNGFTDKVFRENYELNSDFVPDEIALTDLINSLIPIMEKAYGERIKRTKSKYSAKKRGKHTQNKEELIAQHTGKGGSGE